MSQQDKKPLFFQYLPGDTNLVITVPHGGSTKPSGWPERRKGCKDANNDCIYGSDCTPGNESSSCSVGTAKDSYTKEIGLEIQDWISNNYNFIPHVIYCDVHR